MIAPEQAAALARCVDWVRTQIRKDRANRYSLLHDWQLPACRCSFWPDAFGVWESDLLRIVRNAPGIITITVKAYQSTAADNVCDGATLSPDNIPGILPAALFHDPWYYRDTRREGPQAPKQYEALADLIGVPRRKLRAFGDAVFYSIARAGGCPWIVAQLYHFGIRAGYPIVRPFLAGALVALLAGGCVGCGGDGSFLSPGDFTPPDWIGGQ